MAPIVNNMAKDSSSLGVSVGDRVELLRTMADPHPVEAGATGTVTSVVDSPGYEQIMVDWDNGRRLAIIPGVDRWRKV
jgi:hypothetical protein